MYYSDMFLFIVNEYLKVKDSLNDFWYLSLMQQHRFFLPIFVNHVERSTFHDNLNNIWHVYKQQIHWFFFLTALTGNFWDSLAESYTQKIREIREHKTTFCGAHSIPAPPAWSSFVDLRRQWCRDRCHCRLSWCSWCRRNSENTLLIILCFAKNINL